MLRVFQGFLRTLKVRIQSYLKDCAVKLCLLIFTGRQSLKA